MHLDTVCTMVDVDAVVMYPAVADTLQAWTVTADAGRRRRVSTRAAQPFLEAAADAMGIDRLRVIDTGLDPVTAEPFGSLRRGCRAPRRLRWKPATRCRRRLRCR